MLNNSFEELERKYNKLQRKKIFKIFLIIGTVFSLGFFAFDFFKKEKLQIQEKSKIKETKEKAPNLELKPKIDLKELKPIIEKKEKINATKITPPTKEEEMPKEIFKRKTKKIQKKKLNNIKIEDEKTLKQNYLLYGDYKSAISLSKLFLEKKNYKKAIKWAIRATKYAPGDDEPWIIYAKAKASMGQKELAIKTLKTYLKKHKSKRAEKLLKKYQRGKK